MTTTAQKRSAAAGLGVVFSITVPFPNGTDDQASRWQNAFCYLREILPTPVIGWEVSRRERVFKTESVIRVFAAARSPRVWRFPERM